jgi:hypothetical protein
MVDCCFAQHLCVCHGCDFSGIPTRLGITPSTGTFGQPLPFFLVL